MVCMPARTTPKTNNERLRELIVSTELSQPQALALFNRGLGPAAYSASAWKSFLVSPTSARYRPFKDALLAHAEKVLGRIAQGALRLLRLLANAWITRNPIILCARECHLLNAWSPLLHSCIS